jgi:hypothetical protein
MKQTISAAVVCLIIVTAAAESGSRTKENLPDRAAGGLVENYGEANSCISWTDGCQVCRQDATAGALCSNVVIACIPHDRIVCTIPHAGQPKR